jgi:uncharacterized radical SAM protein YgiQ
VLVYSQRCREAYPEVPIVIGGIEASLRRVAHYDYWSDKVRRSVLPDSKADLLLYGNAERALVALTHRLAAGESVVTIRDLRGTAFMVARDWRPGDEWTELAAADPALTAAGGGEQRQDPLPTAPAGGGGEHADTKRQIAAERRSHQVVRLPAYDQVRADALLYAHASRTLHLESNPGNARALVQAHGSRNLWLNPPPLPLTTPELDYVFGLPYARAPHPSYGEARIPAWEMIRFSVNILRGCFGGCTFCSITEH